MAAGQQRTFRTEDPCLFVERIFSSLVLSAPEGAVLALPSTSQPGTDCSWGHIWMDPTYYDSQN